ncbi:MAG: Fic family protein [Lapillicoccus sp.]
MGDTAAEGYQPFPVFEGWVTDFDSTTVDRFATLLSQARAEALPEAMDRAVTVATRYAAVDTGAIEGLYTTNRGFTRTIAEQTATWEAALRQHDITVERSINDALNGYEMALDFATRSRPITESWVRQLHETLCASQETYEVMTGLGRQRQPMPQGVYKAMPNNPTNPDTGRVFHYAPPLDTPAEMARLVGQLDTSEFTRSHPVVQAAYAHYDFARIHPFADGNGRVARALASVFLYRQPGVPLVVFADQKDEYLDALEAADVGRPLAFVAFVAERCIDTIELVRGSLVVNGEGRRAVADLARDLVGTGGLTHQTIDELNARICAITNERLRERLQKLSLHEGVQFGFGGPAGNPSAPQGYRSSGFTEFAYSLVVQAPVHLQRIGMVHVWSARSDADVPDFAATSEATPHRLEVFRRDIWPAETEVLRIKVDNWVSTVLDAEVRAFQIDLHAALVDAGYLPGA